MASTDHPSPYVAPSATGSGRYRQVGCRISVLFLYRTGGTDYGWEQGSGLRWRPASGGHIRRLSFPL